jgi:hypothetical protein
VGGGEEEGVRGAGCGDEEEGDVRDGGVRVRVITVKNEIPLEYYILSSISRVTLEDSRFPHLRWEV